MHEEHRARMAEPFEGVGRMSSELAEQISSELAERSRPPLTERLAMQTEQRMCEASRVATRSGMEELQQEQPRARGPSRRAMSGQQKEVPPRHILAHQSLAPSQANFRIPPSTL